MFFRLTVGFLVLVATACGFSAVPSHEDVKSIMPGIAELTADDFAALKAKKITHAELCDKLLGYIADDDKAETKFAFRQMAFRQLILGMEFDRARELYVTLRGDEGLEYAVMVTETSKSRLFTLATNKRPAAKALLGMISADEKSIRGIFSARSRLKKDPSSPLLLESLALEYIAAGEWSSALAVFRSVPGEIAKISDWELGITNGDDFDAKYVAEFWWTFADGHAAHKRICESIRVHSAFWYRKAMALGLLTGLEAKIAAKRVAETESLSAAEVVNEQKENGVYMVVDLTKIGPRSVTYLDAAPKNGWQDEHKTKKLVLRKIPAGVFEYSPGKSVTVTKPFYIGVFEVTQRQYEIISKSTPSNFKGDTHPVEQVKYSDIRGHEKGMLWPKSDDVDKDSFIGRLRLRIGLRFDLPTEAQWEYACRAGLKGPWNIEDADVMNAGRFRDNGGEKDHHAVVGSYKPNPWGIYDMLGNVRELCLDRAPDGNGWAPWNPQASGTEIDPKGPETGNSRVRRGGGWVDVSDSCRVTSRSWDLGWVSWYAIGFRVVCNDVQQKKGR